MNLLSHPNNRSTRWYNGDSPAPGHSAQVLCLVVQMGELMLRVLVAYLILGIFFGTERRLRRGRAALTLEVGRANFIPAPS
jgi:hypothetical protein